MTAWIEPVATGRGQFTHEYDLRSSNERVTATYNVTDRATWVPYMYNLSYAALDALNGEGTVADETKRQWSRASAVALVLAANESAWGDAQWWGNAMGIHCGSGAYCMRFPAGRGDRELRAFVDAPSWTTAQGAALQSYKTQANFSGWIAFWHTVSETGEYARQNVMSLYRAGRLGAVTATERAGWRATGRISDTDLRQIYRYVYDTLTAGNAGLRAWLLTPEQAQGGYVDQVDGTSGPVGPQNRPTNDSSSFWWIAAAVVAAIAYGKGR